jgi:hypothetical protein
MEKVTFRKSMYVFGLVMVLAFMLVFPTQAAHAQADNPLTADQVLAEIMKLVTGGFVSLVGVPALIAALINVLKFIGLVKDDTSPNWSAGLSLVAFIAVILTRVLRPDIMLDVLDGYAGQIAQIIVYLMSFVVIMLSPAIYHAKLKAAMVPLLGKSYSL